MKTPSSLRDFIQTLREANELHEVFVPVDPYLEIAEIHRRVVLEHGKALLFHNVKGSSFAVVTNLFGSKRRVDLAFGTDIENFISEAVHLLTHSTSFNLKTLWNKRHLLKNFLRIGLKEVSSGPILDYSINPVNLEKMPFLTTWPKDGGPFLTLPLVYTESIYGTSKNLGMYRIQRFDKQTTGLHFQIGKGAGFHFHEAEQANTHLPVSIFLGGPPALILSAIAPLPENVPELLFASVVMKNKLALVRYQDHPHLIPAESEFALLGTAAAHVRKLEGPFGDHYGYMSQAHDFPVFNCKTILHRKDAIFPATVVGKPPQEDLYIGNYLQQLFSPLIKMTMPQVRQIHTYAESGFHPFAAAIVKERYTKEALSAAFRILGEGQLSLTKCLFVTDQNITLENAKIVFETILERMDPRSDLYILTKTSNDTLDYTGPKLNIGSKAIFIGVGQKKRQLPVHFSGTLPRPFKKLAIFSAGCLVVEAPLYTEEPDISHAIHAQEFKEWPLIVIVDNVLQATASQLEFLWTLFTRFSPSCDLYSHAKMERDYHIEYSFPIIIDARMKPHYPEEVTVDDDTKKLVDTRWDYYFSKK